MLKPKDSSQGEKTEAEKKEAFSSQERGSYGAVG